MVTYNIGRLDVILELSKLLLEIIKTNLVILNDQVDLELADTVTDWHKLGGTPDKSILGDGTNGGLKGNHVGLIVPWLDIHGDNGLGGWLDLTLLLLAVLLQALLADTGSLGILLLVVGSEKVDILILLLLGGWGLGWVQGDLSGLWAVSGVWLAGVALEVAELLRVGGNVLVPSGSVWVLGGIWCGGDGLEGGNISLGWCVTIGMLVLDRGDAIANGGVARRCRDSQSELHKCLGLSPGWEVLISLLKHGPMSFIM